MQQAKIGIHVMVFGLILIWIHMTAMRFHWYWHMPWFDSISHFIGGIFAAFVMVFFVYLYMESKGRDVNEAYSARTIIFGAFVIGCLWEIFEHFFNVSIDPLSSLDTVIDLAMDTLGALVVYWYVRTTIFLNFNDKEI